MSKLVTYKKRQRVKIKVVMHKKLKINTSCLKIQIFPTISNLSALTFIYVGSICGVAPCGNKTKRNNFSEQTNYCKWSASLKPRVDVFLTRTSFCLLFKLAIDMACSRWQNVFMSRCARARLHPQMPFSLLSSIIRKKTWDKLGTKTQIDIMPRSKSVNTIALAPREWTRSKL